MKIIFIPITITKHPINRDYFTIVTSDFKISLYYIVEDQENLKIQRGNKWIFLYNGTEFAWDNSEKITKKPDPSRDLGEYYLGTFWTGSSTFTYNTEYKGRFSVDQIISRL